MTAAGQIDEELALVTATVARANDEIAQGGVIDLTASGLAGSQIDDTTVDLGAEPIDFVLPAATIATVDATPLPGGEFDLVVTIPFEIETSLDQVEQENQVLLSGTIVLTGQAIPEPSTLLLLSLGLGGLAYGSRLRS